MMLIISDLHINEKIVEEGILPKLAHFLEEQRLLHNASVLTILGDLWDEHTDPERWITFRVLDAVADFFRVLRFDHIILLKGNHDESFIGLHNLKIISLDQRVKIIDTPQLINVGKHQFFCIPFMKDKDHFQRVIETAPESVIVLMHQTIVGFKLNSFKIAESGVQIQKEFSLVVSGDLHTFQSSNKIIYIGSPYQVRRDEDPHKFMMVIKEDKVSIVEIPTSISQRFIFVNDLSDLDTIAHDGKIIIFTGQEIDPQKLSELKGKGVKIVTTALIKKEVELSTEVDLSGFSLDILRSVISKANDPYVAFIGNELLESLESRIG